MSKIGLYKTGTDFQFRTICCSSTVFCFRTSKYFISSHDLSFTRNLKQEKLVIFGRTRRRKRK